MKEYKEYEVWQGTEKIASHIGLADSFFSRFRGLMLKKSLDSGEGLLLKNCSSIHCFFMRFTIDAVYLDKEMSVVAVECVKPWRIGGFYKGAKHVLELEEGRGTLLRTGEKIYLKERNDK